jgi:diguanylate cyclase (GGDEF)-like protein
MNKIKKIICISITLLFLQFFLHAQNNENTSVKNILVLLSYHQSYPWTQYFLNGLGTVKEKYDEPINFYLVNMESVRLPDALTSEEWIEYLLKKYSGIHIDAVIAESAWASDFLNRNSETLFGSVPKIYFTGDEIKNEPYNKVLSFQYDLYARETFELAIKQNPKTENIYIIRGTNPGTEEIIQNLCMLIKDKPELKYTILENLTYEQYLDEIENTPPNSLIFFTLLLNDIDGKKLIPRDFLSELALVSNAPVYSFWSSFIGSGVVGGYMADGAETAESMVEAAMDYIKNGKFKDEYIAADIFIDWNAVKRFNINENTIPGNAQIFSKPVPFLDLYLMEVLQVITVIVLVISLFTIFWIRKLSKMNKKLKVLNREVIVAKNNAEILARTDMLTGMDNRLAFFEKAEQICRQVKRLKKPKAVLMIDIDHFKSINDKYGHPAGDLVIKKIAFIIITSKREVDVAARFGGEEFVIIVPFTDEQGALNLAERIRNEAENSIIRYDNKKIKFTVSIGIFGNDNSHNTYNACDLDEALKRADEALYEAKSTGRNSVVKYNLK